MPESVKPNLPGHSKPFKVKHSSSLKWDQLEEELLQLGVSLDELRSRSEQVGAKLMAEIENHYNTLLEEAAQLRKQTEISTTTSSQLNLESMKEKTQEGLVSIQEKAKNVKDYTAKQASQDQRRGKRHNASPESRCQRYWRGISTRLG